MKTIFRTFGMLLGLAVVRVAGFALFVAARGVPRYEAPAVAARPPPRGTPAVAGAGRNHRAH